MCQEQRRKKSRVLWGPMRVGVYHRLGNTWVTDQGFGDNVLEEVSGPVISAMYPLLGLLL